jgi:hypothetical protein
MQRRGTKSEKNGDSSREGNHIVGERELAEYEEHIKTKNENRQ